MQSIDSWITSHANFTPDKVAILFEGESLTYGEFAAQTEKAASFLTSNGIDRGDRVAYLGLNRPEMLVLLFACAQLGAILVPLNWRLTPTELSGIVEDASASILFYDEHFSSEDYQSVSETSAGCQAIDINKLTNNSAQDFESRGTFGDPVLIVYTSGTTGKPKGAVLTQEALFYNALNSRHMHKMTEDDLIFVALPLFHVGGLNIQLTPGLYMGATIDLHERFDPAIALKRLTASQTTLGVLVPAAMEAVMTLDSWETADFSNLKALGTGSTIVPTKLIEAFENKNCSVIQVYGSTETCPIAAYQAIGEGKTHPSSTGKPALHCQVRVSKDDLIVTEPDELGEIEVSGPSILSRYWGNETETEKALVNGWFKTGDLGCWDTDGYLYFKDRKKHLVISGGENISPAEIEAVIMSTGKVKECVVVGVPDERWGEVPLALIVLKDETTKDEIDFQTLFQNNLARFKHPKQILFRGQLPRSAMGKIQPHIVREQVLAELS